MRDQAEYDIQRGEHAVRLLADPLLGEAFQVVEQELTNQWLSSPVRDAEGREKLYLTLLCLRKARSQLETVIQTGQIAAHKVSLAQKAGQMLKQGFSR